MACARRKHLPLCIAFRDGRRLVPLQVPRSIAEQVPRGLGNAEIATSEPFRDAANEVGIALKKILSINSWNALCVAIDAPAAPPQRVDRACETALSSMRLSSFFTPTVQHWTTIRESCAKHLQEGGVVSRLPYANKIWMLFGFQLFRTLRSLGFETIEVYPYAIVSRIGDVSFHKKTVQGYESQLNAIAARTGWSPSELHNRLKLAVRGSKDDRLDALMACWVASLPESEREVIGDENDPNDSIWVPKPDQRD